VVRKIKHVNDNWSRVAKEPLSCEKQPGKHDGIEGIEFNDKVIEIDQSPMGGLSQHPATYTGVFDQS
jgi:excinuclease ABC subunit A